MAKSLLSGKLGKDKLQTSTLTPEQVEAMHNAMTATPTAPSVATPTITNITTKPKATAPKNISTPTETPKKAVAKKEIVAEVTENPIVNEVITRLSIDVPKDIHKKMKLKVIDTEQSIRDYVINLIKKDLGV